MREAPRIPVPKSRVKARWSLVLICDSGPRGQIELTPFRIRLGIGLAVLTLVCASAALIWGVKSGTGSAMRESRLRSELVSVNDDLLKKENNISLLEKRVRELQDAAVTSSIARQPSAPARSESEDNERTGFNPFKSSAKSEFPIAAAAGAPEDEAGDEPQSEAASKTTPSGSVRAEKTPDPPSPPKAAIMNFNAQEVTAHTEGSGANSGALSFRLTKDQPETRFSGYLFVFVEMTDQRGENKIFVYPKAARLGEEDLPSDYKEGESLTFKYNTRVELPFGDRSGAELARVSILLYGENGKIVFQRGFERKELKVTASRPPNNTGGARAKAGEKRRAL